MTPKEKAFELTHKYRLLEIKTSENSFMMISMEDAKKCALIAVEEQINIYNKLNSIGLLKDNSIGFELIEVKQEIEKL